MFKGGVMMTIEIQQKGINMSVNDIERKVKDYWKMDQRKVKDISSKNANVYFVPEEEMVYFVINQDLKDEMKGEFHISEIFDLKAE